MRRQQRGITLVLSMIMLVLLTIVALSTFNIGKSGLQVVGNAQHQMQATNAAHSVIQQVISTPNFAESPDNVLDNSNCPVGVTAPANSRCVDLYGDGKTTLVVAMSPQPQCLQIQPIPAASLDLTRPQDLGCAVGENQNLGIAGVVSGASMCSNSLWEVNAAASDPISRAQSSVAQGVSMRISNDSAATSCP
jgi:Tfp pilus assembly protein PilX